MVCETWLVGLEGEHLPLYLAIGHPALTLSSLIFVELHLHLFENCVALFLVLHFLPDQWLFGLNVVLVELLDLGAGGSVLIVPFVSLKSVAQTFVVEVDVLLEMVRSGRGWSLPRFRKLLACEEHF